MEYSDHKKPQLDLNKMLPEVYVSDISTTLNTQAFNRFLTKTDTTHIAGTVGDIAPSQIIEPTPYRNANQLVPTMVSQTGSEKHVMSFKMFREQLELVGVDFTRFEKWANTTVFNWIPPVHLDKLINYKNYYWAGDTSSETPQYLTIENSCKQKQFILQELTNTIARDGDIFAVSSIDYITNAIIIEGDFASAFASDTLIYTTNSNLSVFNNTYWTIHRSFYNTDTNLTTIILMESISTVSTTAPVNPMLDKLWFDISTNILYQYDGVEWADISSLEVVVDVYMQPILAFFQADYNAACGEKQGWDTKPWDDNQIGDIIWSESVLEQISSPTEPTGSPTPQLYDLWNDTTTDTLKQFDGADWIVVVQQFSSVASFATGRYTFDDVVDSVQPALNQWQVQNRWIPALSVTNTTNIQRAQRPILEYDSRLELNDWTKKSFSWKYRPYTGNSYVATSVVPTRLELEPITSYTYDSGSVYLVNTATPLVVMDANYSDSFAAGKKVVFTDFLTFRHLYTCKSVQYREPNGTDPLDIQASVNIMTVVQFEESFISPVDSLTGCVIIPNNTNMGDAWEGYNNQWVLSSDITTSAASPKLPNLFITEEYTDMPVYEPVTIGNNLLLPISGDPSTVIGLMVLTSTFQEVTVQVNGIDQIILEAQLIYNPTSPNISNYFALPNSIKVYKNNLLMYGGYTEDTVTHQIPVYSGQEVSYVPMTSVTGIQLAQPLVFGDIIKICIAPESFYDMGKQAVAVRTIENDVEYEVERQLGNQPVIMSLVENTKTPQIKTEINQYPLFNVYDVITGEISEANPLFTFEESSEYAIDRYLRKRIVLKDGDYHFEQHLLGEQDQLLAFRLYNNVVVGQFWYNPATDKIQVWDGLSWTPYYITYNPIVASTIIISDLYPTNEDIIPTPETLWYVRTTNSLLHLVDGDWEVKTDVISGADPTLQTIWRSGSNNEQAVPVYINRQGIEVSYDDPSGDWKQPDQWFYNPEHVNSKFISFKEISYHANSVIQKQSTYNGKSVAELLSQDSFNYGLGGTIHDYNDSFDTLISAIDCNLINVPGVVDFASHEYNKALHSIQEIFYSNATTLLQNNVIDVADYIISVYENNDINFFVYGDTSAYVDGVGIKAFPATPPMFGLSTPIQPHLNISNSTIELVHHDGHRSLIVLDTNRVVNYTDPLTHLVTRWNTKYTQRQLQLLLATTLLEVEQRLYDVTVKLPVLVFDYSTLTADIFEQQFFNKYERERFSQYIALYNISMPYVNKDFNPTDPFTWNYLHCTDYNTTPVVSEPTIDLAASWQQLYTNVYGTPYPHLEPWVLQGYVNKPLWWDVEYVDINNARMWLYNHATEVGMWKNIMTGIVPVGRSLPNGMISEGIATDLPTYNYVSVNIGDSSFDGYEPDQLLPPYKTNITDPAIRSIFDLYEQIQDKPISADYIFGDGSPLEWQWRNSLEYRYDTLIIAFRMQPSKFLHAAFGPRFEILSSLLQVEIISKKVYSHRDMLFHGDLTNDNQEYLVDGLNQWYVNFTRSSGYDTSLSMRERWIGWSPKLTYQTAGILDKDTLDVFNANVDITDADFDVTLVNNGIVDDIWVDGFAVTIQSVPPSSLVQDVQSKWRFQLDTLSPQVHSLTYYGVVSFPCGIDYTESVLTAYQYNIVEASNSNHLFYVTGDQTSMFVVDQQFEVTNSNYNDGTYTVIASAYELTTDRTRISISTPVLITDDSALGTITLLGYVLPWQTGDMIVLSTDSTMPIPLQKNTPYFVYRITNTNSFKLAYSSREANAGVTIDFRVSAPTSLTASEVKSSFIAFNGASETQTLWYHYAIDYSRVLSITPPTNIRGMQSLINLFDGYAAYQESKGVMYDMIASTTYDSELRRSVSWQTELERFIDWAHGIKAVMMQVTDKHQLTVADLEANEFTFIGASAKWPDHTQIVMSTSGTLPTPLLSDVSYYVHNIIKPGKLVATASDILTGATATGLANDTTLYTVVVTVNNFTTTTVAVVGQLAQTYQQLVDIINQSLVYDAATCSLQDNQLLITSTVNEAKSIVSISSDNLFVALPLIENIQSVGGTNNTFNLSITDDITNPANIVNVSTIGSGILYGSIYAPLNKFPTFEVNPSRDNIWISTPQGVLADVIAGPQDDLKIQQTIFDQYGRPMTSDKLTTYRQDLRSRIQVRPTIANDISPTFTNDIYNYIHFGGGHFFIEAYEHFIIFNDYTTTGDLVYNPFLGIRSALIYLDYYESSNYTLRPNLGGYYLVDNKFERNIEGSIEDMQNIYDARANPEVREFVDRGRAITNYKRGRYDYLDSINAPMKSQFDFYRGLIKHKGSVQSLTAFTNSKRVEDLIVDEYWAWKVAQYGESRPRIYPELVLQPSDSIVDDIRMMFLTNFDSVEDEDIAPAVAQGFHPISFVLNTDRWYQFPQQKAEIQTTMFLNGQISSQTTIFGGTTAPIYNEVYGTQYWFDKNSNITKAWNIESQSWEETTAINISTDGVRVYIAHDICDTVRIVKYNPNLEESDFGAILFEEGTGINHFTIVNSEVTRILYNDLEDILLLFTITPSPETNSPVQVVDIKNNNVVRTMPFWHPAVGLHYNLALHSLDLINDTDPALYNSTLVNSAISEKPWNITQAGTMWLDSHTLGYIPYYDKTIYPDINDRLYNWGKQAEWSETKVYQWVKSPVPPAQWTTQAALQSPNQTIEQASKITGTAKKSLFSRTRTAFECIVNVSPSSVIIEDAPIGMDIGSPVMFTSTGTLPPSIEENVVYYVASITVDDTQSIIEVVDSTTALIVEFSGGTGVLSLIPSFDLFDWIKQPTINEKHYIAIDFPGIAPVVNPTIVLTNPLWIVGDIVDVYVNGKRQASSEDIVVDNQYQVDLTALDITLYEKDVVVIRREKQTLLESESSFNPAVQDDALIMTQWAEDYEFTSVTETVGNNNAQVSVTSFYFWVENCITKESQTPNTLSCLETARAVSNIPIPYVIVQDPQNDPVYRDKYGYGITPYGDRWSMISLNDPQHIIPIVYRQVVLRKLSDIVKDSDRYIARFQSNYSKRDNDTSRKDIHEDWMLIRRTQNDRIDQRLWTALTEAVVGYKTNSQQPVPSLDRIQYDLLNGTDTQYGLDENQAFVNKQYALATIQHYLNDPNNVFDTIDINKFLNTYSFDTPANIKTAMDEIYNTFLTQDINNIWFNTLLDAFVTKAKYKGLMKTSWISVVGSQQFNTLGT